MNNPFKTYFKTAFRSLTKHKLSAILNVSGLAIGITSALIIGFYIQQETSYDRFYDESEKVYRLNTYWKQEESDEKFATTPPPLAPLLGEVSPNIAAYVRVYKQGDFTMRPDHDFNRPFRETNAWTVGEDFLEVLNHGVLAGNKETMLKEPRSVVMPKSTAIRYFGREAFEKGNVVGRMLGGGADGGTKWQVTGVIPDQPENSHFQFDMLLTPAGKEALNQINWGWLAFYTYIRVKDNSTKELSKIEDQLELIVANHAAAHFGTEIEELREEGLDMRYSLQPLTDIHLKSALLREMEPNGNLIYVRSMMAVALFIIILACVNFVNLTTARSAVRAKEIGIRKMLGSHRRQLIQQFLLESVLMACIALVIAFGMVECAAIILRSTFNWSIDTSYMHQPGVFLTITMGVIFLGLLAGAYPALYLTRFQPSQVLKGKQRGSRSEKNIRNGLVVFQFVVSITLIISTLIINRQVNYIQTKDLGFNKEQVLIIHNDREIDERREEFKNLLKTNPAIVNTSFSTGIPGLPQYMRRDFTHDEVNASLGINWFQADDSFLSTLDIQIVQGRGFDQNIASDTAALLLNQKAVQELGLDNPIGTFMTINKGANDERRVQVIGVIKDFNLQSFDREIGTLALEYLNDFNFKDYIAIRMASGKAEASIDFIRSSWAQLEPNVPMVYSFLDEDFQRLFKSEIRLSKIFGGFTFLAILIACLGLFGLASYTNAQRTKEISIRKVLGASVLSMLGLLYHGYLRIIVLAFALAGLIAYALMTAWLSNFVYRTQIGIQSFVTALIGTLIIAGLTVTYHSLRTASLNPSETLKNE